MSQSLKKLMITLGGGFLVFIGVIFILVPGPAFLFLPIGLAILSLEYPVARDYLKKTQRLMRKSAELMDKWIAKIRK